MRASGVRVGADLASRSRVKAFALLIILLSSANILCCFISAAI